MTDKIVVLTACGSAGEAGKIAQRLVELRLAACVTIVPGAISTYRWKDAIENSQEWLLTIKTRRPLFERVQREIEALHSYDLPEVIALTVVDGSGRYLDWLDAETGGAH